MSACSEGDLYLNHLGFKIVLLCQIIPSAIAVFTNICFLRTGFQRIYFHDNLKFSIAASLICNIFHCGLLVIVQLVHLTLYVSQKNGCSVYVPVSFCLIFRGLITLASLCFVPLNLVMIMERALATQMIQTYEESLKWLKHFFLLIAMALSISMLLYSLWYTPWTGTSAYCSAVNQYTSENISIGSYVFTGIELFTIIGYGILYLWNQSIGRRRAFDFKAAYQVQENLNALNLLFPWILFHYIAFTFFYLSNGMIPYLGNWIEGIMPVRTAYAAVYVAPVIYCMLTPFLLSYIGYKQRQARIKRTNSLVRIPTSGLAYENYLTKQWW